MVLASESGNQNEDFGDPHTLHVISQDFYAGYKQATLDFELEYKPKVTTFDDIQITTIFVNCAYCTKTDLWKTGYQAGFFAALYGIPYTWMFGTHERDLHYGMMGLRRVS